MKILPRGFFLRIFSLVFLGLQQHKVVGSVETHQTLDYGIIEWIEKNDGGYYNPKQEIRMVSPDNSDSEIGVFATKTIEEKEVLFQVPLDIIIGGSSHDEQECRPDGEESSFHCGTVYFCQHTVR